MQTDAEHWGLKNKQQTNWTTFHASVDLPTFGVLNDHFAWLRGHDVLGPDHLWDLKVGPTAAFLALIQSSILNQSLLVRKFAGLCYGDFPEDEHHVHSCCQKSVEFAAWDSIDLSFSLQHQLWIALKQDVQTRIMYSKCILMPNFFRLSLMAWKTNVTKGNSPSQWTCFLSTYTCISRVQPLRCGLWFGQDSSVW